MTALGGLFRPHVGTPPGVSKPSPCQMGGVISPASSRSTTESHPSVEFLGSLQREGYLEGIQEQQQQHLALP